MNAGSLFAFVKRYETDSAVFFAICRSKIMSNSFTSGFPNLGLIVVMLELDAFSVPLMVPGKSVLER